MICNRLEACAQEALSKVPVSKCDNKNETVCIASSDCRSSVKCKERRKKYILENTRRNHVVSYKMDGGIIVEDKSVPAKTNKCDYLYIVRGEETLAILTELKGDNVSQALKQINGTLALFKDFFRSFSHVYGRAIITSSTPNLKASPEYVKLVKTIRQTYKGNIKIVERQFSEKDIELSIEQ